MNEKLLKQLVDLAQDAPLAGNTKSLDLVEGNGFTGLKWETVPHMKDLQQLKNLGFIKLIESSGTLFDIIITSKALCHFG